MNYFFIILLFIPFSIFAQGDKSVSQKNIPTGIPAYINKKYSGHGKVTYYKELDSDTVFFEANFKFEANKYSLLFDTSGKLIETEIEITFECIQDSVQSVIKEKLEADFTSYKIIVIQLVDYRGQLLYEIEVSGKKEKEVEFYEYYFNRSGVFIKVEAINLKSIPSLF